MTALAPPRVPLARVFLVCSAVLAAEIPIMLVAGQSWHQTLLPGYLIILVSFGTVFCLAAVTVAGFVTGMAAAGLLVLGDASLVQLICGAGLLALVCGAAPGWARVEAWQSSRFRFLTAGEEAALGSNLAPTVGRHRPGGPRVRVAWRTDRVVAAFLVLAFPPAIAAFGLWFVGWVSAR